MTRDEIIDLLAAAQRDLGLSDRKVTDRAGVGHGTWGRMKSGRVDPSLGVICRIAAALHVNITASYQPPDQR